jgi:hypothetical protein
MMIRHRILRLLIVTLLMSSYLLSIFSISNTLQVIYTVRLRRRRRAHCQQDGMVAVLYNFVLQPNKSLPRLMPDLPNPVVVVDDAVDIAPAWNPQRCH